MDKLIRKSWWKYIGVLLLVYVFVAGMLIPLKPNVPIVNYQSANLGKSLELELVGYNTQFTQQADDTRSWLCFPDSLKPHIAASEIEIIDDRIAKLRFELPASMPTDASFVNLSLIVDGAFDGVYIRPDAVRLENKEEQSSSNANWDYGKITGLNETSRMTFPARRIIEETIRNTYFHVALWLAMVILFAAAVVYAIRYLRFQKRAENGEMLPEINGLDVRQRADLWSMALTEAGLLLGVLGLITGFLWAKYTWGSYWSGDIKQYTTMIALLIYSAYFILRVSFSEPEQRGRISAAYNIFAFVLLIPLIYILPRLSGNSLHPGNAGNPAFGSQDLDGTMRMVFYPAVLGWTLLACWMASLRFRISHMETQIEQNWENDFRLWLTRLLQLIIFP
ncbi:MAG: cytochrome c biogenesis protein CcsA, partial [Bacteroidota bacterium]